MLVVSFTNFLCGFISPSIVQIQEKYLQSLNSKKNSSRWASNLISQLWKIVHKIWCHRNSILHDKHKIDELSGLSPLQQAITSEFNRGYENLPPTYSSYFHHPLQFILSKPVSYQKQWFLVIRSAREAYDNDIIQDEFSSDGPLRKWIGYKEEKRKM